MTGSDYNNIIIDSKESIKMSEKLVLIDGHSILNRAYHGLPDLTNSEGLHTNAVYGFLNIMFKILDEEKPDYLTVAFDVHARFATGCLMRTRARESLWTRNSGSRCL